MKLSLLLPLILCAFSAQAQSSSASVSANREGQEMDYRTVRLGLIFPMLSRHGEMTRKEDGSQLENIDTAFGFNLSYARLPVRTVGFIGGITYIEVAEGGSSNGLARFDANLAFAFDQNLYAKGGLNFSKWTRDKLSELNGEFGLQGGIGYRMFENFGVEFGFTRMSQRNINVGSLTVEGAELALLGSF